MTREEFIRAVNGQQTSLRRFLLVLCKGDSFTADDIAQDACIKAWLSADTFRGASKFSTWLFRIAYNCWYDHRYSSKTEDIAPSSGSHIPDPAQADDCFRHEELYQAIDGLKPNEKSAIVLFYMEGKSIKEISAIMGMKQGSVKSLLSRGRSKLRIVLK